MGRCEGQRVYVYFVFCTYICFRINTNPGAQSLEKTASPHSPYTRVVGTPHTVTWKPRLSPCVKTRGWQSFPGLHSGVVYFCLLSRDENGKKSQLGRRAITIWTRMRSLYQMLWRRLLLRRRLRSKLLWVTTHLSVFAIMTLNRRMQQALAYLFHQSTYVIPIAGVQSVDHIKVMNDAITTRLSFEEIQSIQDAAPFEPLFPMSFLFGCKNGKGYSTRLTPADNLQYGMWARFDAPEKRTVRIAFRANNISLSVYTHITTRPTTRSVQHPMVGSTVNKRCVLNRTVYRFSATDNITVGGMKIKFNLGICLNGIYQ